MFTGQHWWRSGEEADAETCWMTMFDGGYCENILGAVSKCSVAEVWVAKAHLMSWEMIWVEDTVLVFDLSKVLD